MQELLEGIADKFTAGCIFRLLVFSLRVLIDT